MTENFKQHLEELVSLDTDAWNELREILRISELQQGDCYLEKGKKTVNEVFVVRGILRSYYISPEGEEINVAFYTDGNVLPPLHFRSRESLSIIDVQALSDVILCEFNAQDFTGLRYKYPSLMKYGNLIVENELEYKTQREIMLLSHSASERYLYFRQTFPGLENQISQYHIASYLGITPVSLSRIRKELAKG